MRSFCGLGASRLVSITRSPLLHATRPTPLNLIAHYYCGTLRGHARCACSCIVADSSSASSLKEKQKNERNRAMHSMFGRCTIVASANALSRAISRAPHRPRRAHDCLTRQPRWRPPSTLHWARPTSSHSPHPCARSARLGDRCRGTASLWRLRLRQPPPRPCRCRPHRRPRPCLS